MRSFVLGFAIACCFVPPCVHAQQPPQQTSPAMSSADHGAKPRGAVARAMADLTQALRDASRQAQHARQAEPLPAATAVDGATMAVSDAPAPTEPQAEATP